MADAMDLDYPSKKRGGEHLLKDGGNGPDNNSPGFTSSKTKSDSKRQKTTKSTAGSVNSGPQSQSQSKASAIETAINSVLSQFKEPDDVADDDTQRDIKSCLIENSQLKAEIASLRSAVAMLSNKVDFLLSFVGVTDGQPTGEKAAAASDSASAPSSSHEPLAKSYASCAASTSTIGTALHSSASAGSRRLCQNVVAAVYHDLHDKSRRARNFVISGLPPRSGVSDKDSAFELITKDIAIHVDIKGCKRLGKPVLDRVQPLLVTVDSQVAAESVIGSARKLRSSADPYVRDHVFINADLTPAESKALYDERCRRRTLAEQQKSGKKNDHKQGPDMADNTSSS